MVSLGYREFHVKLRFALVCLFGWIGVTEAVLADCSKPSKSAVAVVSREPQEPPQEGRRVVLLGKRGDHWTSFVGTNVTALEKERFGWRAAEALESQSRCVYSLSEDSLLRSPSVCAEGGLMFVVHRDYLPLESFESPASTRPECQPAYFEAFDWKPIDELDRSLIDPEVWPLLEKAAKLVQERSSTPPYDPRTEAGCVAKAKTPAEALKNCEKEAAAIRARENALRGTVAVSFSGDQAGFQGDNPQPGDSSEAERIPNEEFFKLGTDLHLSVGWYPRQIRVRSGASFQLRDGELEEDLTRLLFTYKQYWRPSFETFVFAERFSDSFMSIDQRWEIGGGVKLEWARKKKRGFPQRYGKADPYGVGLKLINQLGDALGPTCLVAGRRPAALTERGNRRRATLVAALRRDEELATAAGRLQRARSDLMLDQSHAAAYAVAQAKVEEVCRHLLALEKEEARYEFGFSTAVFAELERATVTVRSADSESREFGLKADQLYRYSLRPSFTIRPNDRFSIDYKHYLKVKIDGSTDTRQDAELSIDIRVGKDTSNLEDIAITLAVAYHTDNEPPTVPLEVLESARSQDGFAFISPVSARDEHFRFSLSARLGF